MDLAAASSPDVLPVLHPRQAEILRAVRQAFVEKGFDGASMQDLARAAGMSVGNFYRYFPNKAAIIRDMVLMDAQEIQADFAMVLAAEDPLSALREGLHQRIFGAECAQDSALWAEIDAASRRSPEVAAAHRQIQTQVRGLMLAVFAASTGLPQAEANRRFSTHASFLLTLFKAAACADDQAEVDIAALRGMIAETIDLRLEEIRAAAGNSSAPVPPD